MKNRNLIIAVLVLLTFLIHSCNRDDDNQQQIDSFNLEEMNLDLNLISFDKLNKEINVPNNNIETFILKNYEELINMDEDLVIYIKSKDNKNTFVINKINETKYPLVSYENSATMTNCTTCRTEDCVASTLKEAVGYGDRDVDITIRVKSTLGVQTGLEVCYDTDVN